MTLTAWLAASASPSLSACTEAEFYTRLPAALMPRGL